MTLHQTRGGETPMLRPLPLAVLLVLSAGRTLPAADPSAAAVDAAWPARNGLAVQVGAADADFLAGLTGGNGRLVHGLVRDDAQRDRLRGELHRQGVHPLATVATWHDAPRLPYADRLVNLLIIDRDDLGARAPSADEARRVVAPGGTLLQRAGGAWTATRIERPATQGNWTHYDGGADGNSVGDEQEVTALRTWQWIDNYRDLRWQKVGPHGGDGGNIRVWGRYAVWDYAKPGKDLDQSSRESNKGYPDLYVLECRDAANGLPVWRRDGKGGTRGKRRSLAADQGLVFTWLTDDGPLSALDIATGTQVRTYPGSEIKPFQGRDHNGLKTRSGPYGDSYWVRVAGDRVVANGDGTVRAWTLDGKPLWSFGRPEQRVELPVVDAAAKTVYAILIPELPVENRGSGIIWGRWPASEQVRSVIALDLDTGKLRWENTDLASRDLGLRDTKRGYQVRTGISLLLPAGKHLIASNNESIAGGRNATIASIDAATGRTVHFDPRQMLRRIRNDKDPKNQTEGEMEWMSSLYQCVTRDGKVYLMGASMMHTFDPVGGRIEQVLSLPWNARCVRPIATRNAFLLGQTAIIGGADVSGEMVAVARSGCAQSPAPGAGLLMFGPHTCACTTHFDGFLALSPRAAPPALGEGDRLVKPGPPAVPAPAAGEPPASPAARSWPWFTISESVRPQTIEAGGWSFAIDPQRHRVDATGSGGSWSWVADARIGTSVVVAGGVAVFGSHDGWVTGIDLASGAPRWRYLAAPAHRLAVANGMLTSTWPVFGVADLGDGRIVASAGTHAELDGGIRVVALRAADGSLVWSKSIRKTPSRIPPGGTGAQIADRSVMNAIPEVAGGMIVIAGGHHLGRLEFAPDEDEAAISARISAPPARRR